jgi:hypothetical protein
MNKLIAMLLAAVFAGVSVNALAQTKDEKKTEAKKGDAKKGDAKKADDKKAK